MGIYLKLMFSYQSQGNNLNVSLLVERFTNENRMGPRSAVAILLKASFVKWGFTYIKREIATSVFAA